jgi:hypothetical protein
LAFSLLELVRDKSTKEPMDAATMGAIRNQMAADGLTTFVSQSWVFVCPPLVITRDELLTGLKIRALAIADASQGLMLHSTLKAVRVIEKAFFMTVKKAALLGEWRAAGIQDQQVHGLL